MRLSFTLPRPFLMLLRTFRSLAAFLLLALAVVRPAAAIDWTDIWWNPAEAGWGVNLVQSNNFMFATFFIYGQNNTPTWVTANLTVDTNGVWSGPLYSTTGTYYGAPWSGVQQQQVGTATFTPTSSFTGTLTYNVGTTNVAKAIQRQTLTTIPLGGHYSGAVLSTFSNCNNSNNNGAQTSYANLTVTQTISTQSLQFDFDSDFGQCTLVGTAQQNGVLYSIANAAYSCYSGTLSAQVSEVKSTSQGIEGRWTSNVGSAFPGCTENAYFTLLFIY
jgi:hypothetical protein